MGIVDIVIIILLILGLIVGFKRGFLTQTVSLAGFIFIIVGAFLLKNPVSQVLYDKLPFFSFLGVLKGVTIINILLYEIIAFILLVVILWIIFKIIIILSRVLEKVLKFTIIYEIPSKLAGAVLGLIENYIAVFIILYIASLPFFNINALRESKFREPILDKTPILNEYTKSTVLVGEELWGLTEKYRTIDDANAFNLEALDVFLKYKIVTVESIDKLIEKNKLEIDGVETVLSRYR